MSDFTFVHAADLHLNSPFQGLREVSKEVARELCEATFKSLERIVDLCVEEKASFLVLAGDLFDDSNYDLRAWLRLHRQLSRLAEQGIATFAAWGNHDHAYASRREISWPEKVYFFPPGEVADLPVYLGGQEIARIHGISYPRAKITENYATRFLRSNSLFHLGVLHCNVGGQAGYGNYAPCRLEDLIKSGFDYWALGHIHTRAVLHPQHPTIVYPGNSQGRNPRETGVKGCFLVRVNAGRVSSLEFRATDTVRWQVEEVSIEGINTEQELLNKLYDRLEAVQQALNDLPVLVRVYLAGRGKIHRRLYDKLFLEDLLCELREGFLKKRPFLYLESINVETKPEIQESEILKQDSLLGDFFRLARDAQQDAGTLAVLKKTLSSLFNNRRLGRFLQPPTDEQLTEWLEHAAWLGIDFLAGEEE